MRIDILSTPIHLLQMLMIIQPYASYVTLDWFGIKI